MKIFLENVIIMTISFSLFSPILKLTDYLDHFLMSNFNACISKAEEHIGLVIGAAFWTCNVA